MHSPSLYAFGLFGNIFPGGFPGLVGYAGDFAGNGGRAFRAAIVDDAGFDPGQSVGGGGRW